MTDNNFVAEIEEGVVEGSDPTETVSPTPLRKMENRLSVVSRQYDIDGDGVLDPAELASRLYLSSRCIDHPFRVPHRHYSHAQFHLCFLDTKLLIEQRNLDRSGRGYLTNEKVYALMQEQLALQKSMFQMKKIIWG